ncbi:MAG: ornithine--oxo-acid transaminase [Sphingomonadales bacterium]|nr:ornithine--oxo-acid transaminase [Sphingomonadales bacterium]MBM3924076.1 ornithine--oxo-acid transaminase [Sphingomonadales bacterium]
MAIESPPISALDLEHQYGAQNYHPLPVVLHRGSGCRVWDTDGKEYLDFLSAYSAVNQGHAHPRLIKVLHEQSSRLTLTSRAFHNDKLGKYCEFMCQTFGFDRLLPMNTGVEAAETSVKLARRWAYEVKGVAPDCALLVFPEGNFWGRSIGAISASSDPESYGGFGPLVPGFVKVPYNDLAALESAFQNPNVAAFMLEPIQGEAGVVVPDQGYLASVRALCTKYRVLMIADEIQTGLGRTGALLACDHEHTKPDILVLAKALGGGMLPVSAVLCADEIMLTVRPGQHGSTFGGNPLACAVASEAVQIILDENLPQNAASMGCLLREGLQDLVNTFPILQITRGKGLLQALVFDKDQPDLAWNFCVKLMELGLLAKPTHGHIVRLAPPLVINGDEIYMALERLNQALRTL